MRSLANRTIATVVTFALVATLPPLLQAAPASAAGSVSSVTDTTAAEFNAGVRTGNAIVTDTDGGELTLSAPPNTFSTSTVPSTWTTAPWTEGGTNTIQSGQLHVSGANAVATTTSNKGAVLEFDATFRDEPWQQAGFTESGFNGPSSASFTTWEGGGLNIYAGGTLVPISSSYLGSQHHYKIAWGTSGFTFTIDNVSVGVVPWTVASGLRSAFCDFTLNETPLAVDNVSFSSNTHSGTFTSRVLDAGESVSWGAADWTAILPEKTSLTVTVRTGNTPTGTGWTSYKAVTAGASIAATSRYLQYKVTVSSTKFGNLPVMKDMTFKTAPVPALNYVRDSTAAEFAKGTLGAGVLTNNGDGELTIAATNGSTTFPPSYLLPTTWSSTPGASGGNWSYDEGRLKIDGARAGTMANAPTRGTVEFDATFTSEAGQHGGFATDYATAANAMFTTKDGTGLFISANGVSSPISSGLLGSSHRYKVAWGTSVITYSVDGAVVGTLNWTTATAMRATFLDTTANGAGLLIDNVAIGTVNGSYTYTSRIHDAGAARTWTTAAWTAALPPNTNVVLSVRTSDLANLSGATYRTVAQGGQINASTRYIQYRAVLTTTNAPLSTPSLQDVQLNWNDVVPTTTTLPGTTTTTAPPAATTNVTVDSITNAYGDNPISLSASVNSSTEVTSGTAAFEILKGDGTAIGTPVEADVIDGTATAEYLLPNNIAVGTYSIHVDYAGDEAFAPSSGIGTLTVTKATLTIKADSKSRTVGAANPNFTATYTGWQDGDNAGDLVGTLKFTTTATAASPVGTYDIVPSGITSNNYNIVYAKGTLTVAKAVLRITADSKTMSYGSALPELTASYSGFINGDGPSSLTGTLTVSTTATSASPVGSYPIIARGVTSPNYTIVFIDGNLVVKKSDVTVRVQDTTKVYGTSNPLFSAIYSGLAEGESASVLGTPVFTTTANEASGVDSYGVQISGLASSNYNVTTVDGTITVTPAELAVKADDKSKTYGADVPALTVTYTGFVNGDSAAALTSPATVATEANASSGVGTYAITVSGATSPNYSITHEAGVLTVGQAVVTVKVDNAAKLYGDANPAFTARYQGFVNGDGPASLDGTPVFTTVANDESAIGSYAVQVSGLSSTNYLVKFVDGKLSVVPATATVTVKKATKVYGTANPAFAVSIKGLVNGDSLGTPVFTTDATAASGVGTYAVSASGLDTSNYSITYVAGELTVTKASLTVTANDVTKAYGAAVPALSARIDGLVNGDTDADLVGTLSVTSTATESSAVGLYETNASGLSSNNYDITFVGGKLDVTPVDVTVKVNGDSKVYGSANPAFGISVLGLVNGDDAAALGSPVFATDADAASGVGSYLVSVSGLASNNYVVHTEAGTLDVTPAALTVKADNKFKSYGAAVPNLTASYNGFVNGDNALSLTSPATLFTPAFASSDTGTYAITAFGAASPNYSITYVAGVLTINQAVVTVKVDNATKVYGSANPAFTASYSGLINGDGPAALTGTAVFSTDANEISGVGSYNVSVSGLTSNNYIVKFVDGTLAVTPAPVTVKVDNATKVYGSANPAFAVSTSGLVNGDVLGTLVFATDATASSNAGTYAVSASALETPNYSITYVAGELVVTKAALTVTAKNATKAYGSNNPVFAANVDGLVNGDSAADLDGNLAFTTPADATSNVDTYPVAVRGVASDNYDISFVDGTLEITPVDVTVKVNDSTKIYGTDNPVFGVSVGGLVNGDSASVLGTPVFATDATATSGVGSYAVNVSGLASGNYMIYLVNGTLSVLSASATVTVNDATKVYGSANPVFSVTTSGLVNGDALGTPVFTTDATSASGVGTYAVSASGLDTSNYDITYVAGKLVVTKANLTVSAKDATRAYGAANPAFAAGFDGFVNGDGVEDLNGAALFTTAAEPGTGVGRHAVAVSGFTSNNYDISFVDGTLEITPVDVTVKVIDSTKVYGSANPAFGISVLGLVNGDDAAVLGTPVFATDANDASGVGSYTVTVSGLASGNYLVHTEAGSLNVTPAALTIKADSKFKTYGAAMPGLTASYNGFVNGDDALSLVSPVTLFTPADASSGVGTYGITASGASSPNYSITFVDGELTVGQAVVTVKVDNAGKVYGSANPAFTASYAGLVNGDGPAALDGSAVFGTDANEASGVGSYKVSVSGLTSNNYIVKFVDGTLAVTPALVTVTVNDSTKVYGNANPVFSVTTSGLVNGDALGTPVFATEAVASSNAGTYAVAVSGLDTPNYSITYVAGELVVTKAGLTVTANSATKTYGSDNPVFAANIDGFVNGDGAADLDGSLVFTTAAGKGSNVDTYPVAVSGVASNNYDVSFVDGTLEITPADVSVKVIDSTKVYGSNNPAFAISAQGLVNGDSVVVLGTPVFATDASATSGVGAYAVSVSGLTSSNYAIRTANGTLKVTPAALTITANDKFKVYGAAVPALTASYDGFVNGDTVESLDSVGALATLASATSAAGTYVILAPKASNPNYNITLVNGTLTVGAAVLTVKVEDSTKVYGAANPAFTATYSGFINGDGPSALRGAPEFISEATASSAVGSYAVHVDGLVARDYDIQFVAGTLSVTPATLNVKVNDATRLYGAVNPAFATTITGYVNGDTAAVVAGSPVFATAAGVASGVGSYPVSVSGLSAANYTVVATNGSLKVTPASLTAKVKDVTRTYGAANPTFGLIYTGLVNGETAVSGTPVFTTTATAASGVGTHTVTASGLSAANYVITFLPGTLTITPASLTIKADDKTKVAGTANPALTSTATGWVNGDTATALKGTLALSTTATTASGAGTYPINVSGVTSPNYRITFVSGTMTVTSPVNVDEVSVDKLRDYLKLVDSILKDVDGGYTLSGQQLDCKTGAAVGTSKVVQSRAGSKGGMKSGLDFKDVPVDTCWKLKLTLTKTGWSIEGDPFKLVKDSKSNKDKGSWKNNDWNNIRYNS